jgi:hypothetical protein
MLLVPVRDPKHYTWTATWWSDGTDSSLRCMSYSTFTLELYQRCEQPSNRAPMNSVADRYDHLLEKEREKSKEHG